VKFANSLPIIIIFAISFAIYSNTFHSPFHYDDEKVILKNESIRNLKDFQRIFISNPSRPVLTFSFALNYWWGKLDPFSYHLVNIFLHGLNGVLLFLILRITFPSDFLLSIFTSILFISHPLNTESVTYISSRSGVLCTTFYLLSIIFFIKFLRAWKGLDISGLPLRLFLFYFLSLISFVLSVGTKEIGITLPLVLILYEFWVFRRRSQVEPVEKTEGNVKLDITDICRNKPLGLFLTGLKIRFYILSRISVYIPFFIIILGIMLLRRYFYGTFGNPTFYRDYYKNFLTQGRVTWTYIKLLLFPVNLNVDHEFLLSSSFWEFQTLLSFVGILILFSFVFIIFKRFSKISFSIIFFFLTLIPTSLIPLQDLLSERWLYLPAIGFCLFLALFLNSAGAGSGLALHQRGSDSAEHYMDNVSPLIIEHGKALSPACQPGRQLWESPSVVDKSVPAPLMQALVKTIGVFLILFFAILTFSRNSVWSSEVSLWRDAVRKSPHKARTHNNLGVALAKLKLYDEAIESFEEAIKIDKHYSPSIANLGKAYREKGEKNLMLQQALALFESGNYYLKKGMFKEAIISYKEIIDLVPDSIAAYGNLGIVYMKLNEKELAKECFEKVLIYDPKNEAAKRFLTEIGRNEK